VYRLIRLGLLLTLLVSVHSAAARSPLVGSVDCTLILLAVLIAVCRKVIAVCIDKPFVSSLVN